MQTTIDFSIYENDPTNRVFGSSVVCCSMATTNTSKSKKLNELKLEQVGRQGENCFVLMPKKIIVIVIVVKRKKAIPTINNDQSANIEHFHRLTIASIFLMPSIMMESGNELVCCFLFFFGI